MRFTAPLYLGWVYFALVFVACDEPQVEEHGHVRTETSADHPHDDDSEQDEHDSHGESDHAATAEPSTGASTFGEPLSEGTAVPLATIAAAPEAYAGKTVKTEGEISAVCQRMGCWMEMRADGVAPVRVPMAGHSFFLPKDVSGRHATVEGEVAVRELSEDERSHLESEGALATAQTLEISATGVVID